MGTKTYCGFAILNACYSFFLFIFFSGKFMHVFSVYIEKMHKIQQRVAYGSYKVHTIYVWMHECGTAWWTLQSNEIKETMSLFTVHMERVQLICINTHLSYMFTCEHRSLCSLFLPLLVSLSRLVCAKSDWYMCDNRKWIKLFAFLKEQHSWCLTVQHNYQISCPFLVRFLFCFSVCCDKRISRKC